MSVLKTSVLMSVYYKENPDHFQLSLNSILSEQSQKPDEFVLVCDGPLNESLERVINEYESKFDNIMHVYRLETNQGLGKALKYGLDKCHNSIIIRADSDDISIRERIATQVSYLTHNPEISVLSSYIDEFDYDWNSPIHIKEVPLSHDEIYNMAKLRNPINHMAVAFRKEDIERIGSYRHIPYIEDYELWVRAMVNGLKMANLDTVLVHARVGNGMIERRGNKEYISSWKLLSNYMYENQMISYIEKIRNMVSIYLFIYIPVPIRRWIYKHLLRQ